MVETEEQLVVEAKVQVVGKDSFTVATATWHTFRRGRVRSW